LLIYIYYTLKNVNEKFLTYNTLKKFDATATKVWRPPKDERKIQ